MTSQTVERTWIRTGGYGRFRGEWVKLFTTAVIIILFKSTEVNKYEIIQADSLRKQSTFHDATNSFPTK